MQVFSQACVKCFEALCITFNDLISDLRVSTIAVFKLQSFINHRGRRSGCRLESFSLPIGLSITQSVNPSNHSGRPRVRPLQKNNQSSQPVNQKVSRSINQSAQSVSRCVSQSVNPISPLRQSSPSSQPSRPVTHSISRQRVRPSTNQSFSRSAGPIQSNPIQSENN